MYMEEIIKHLMKAELHRNGYANKMFQQYSIAVVSAFIIVTAIILFINSYFRDFLLNISLLVIAIPLSFSLKFVTYKIDTTVDKEYLSYSKSIKNQKVNQIELDKLKENKIVYDDENILDRDSDSGEEKYYIVEHQTISSEISKNKIDFNNIPDIVKDVVLIKEVHK